MAPPKIPISEAIEKRLDKTSDQRGCWLWMGQRDKDGYGTLSRRPKPIRIHRWAWEQHTGTPLQPDQMVCHRCDNPPCVNPEHLFLGTALANRHDADQKQRSANGSKVGTAILTEQAVRDIRAANGTLKQIASQFATDFTNVWKIRKRISWKHVT